MSVLVLYCLDKDSVKTHLESMGLTFEVEKHGSGPEHYACQVGDNVLEIYPAKKNEKIRFMGT